MGLIVIEYPDNGNRGVIDAVALPEHVALGWVDLGPAHERGSTLTADEWAAQLDPPPDKTPAPPKKPGGVAK